MLHSLKGMLLLLFRRPCCCVMKDRSVEAGRFLIEALNRHNHEKALALSAWWTENCSLNDVMMDGMIQYSGCSVPFHLRFQYRALVQLMLVHFPCGFPIIRKKPVKALFEQVTGTLEDYVYLPVSQTCKCACSCMSVCFWGRLVAEDDLCLCKSCWGFYNFIITSLELNHVLKICIYMNTESAEMAYSSLLGERS